MGPMRMLIHMYNKRTQWTIKDPWVLNQWKSIELKIQDLIKQDFWIFIPTLGNIQFWSIFKGSILSCELYLLLRLCLERLASYEQNTKGPPRKVPASYKIVQVQLVPSGISSDAFCGDHFSVYLEAFWTISTSNFLRIIKVIHTHHSKTRCLSRHEWPSHPSQQVTTPETRCHGSLAAAMVISFNSTGPYSNCFCLRRRHQRTNGTSVVKKRDVRIWLDELPKLRLYFDTWIYINGDNNWEISPFPILQAENPPSDHFRMIPKWCMARWVIRFNAGQRCRSDRSANGQDGEPCSRDQPPDLCFRLRSDDHSWEGWEIIKGPWNM